MVDFSMERAHDMCVCVCVCVCVYIYIYIYMRSEKTDDSSDKGEHQERIQGRGALDARDDVIGRNRVTRCRRIVNSGTGEGKALFPQGSWAAGAGGTCGREVLSLSLEICRSLRRDFMAILEGLFRQNSREVGKGYEALPICDDIMRCAGGAHRCLNLLFLVPEAVQLRWSYVCIYNHFKDAFNFSGFRKSHESCISQ
jgi:hypothetical protein